MKPLKRLNDRGAALIRGDALLPEHPGPEFRDDHLEMSDQRYDHEGVEELLRTAVDEYPRGRSGSAMDKELAPALHRALPFSRRVAADKQIWHYLTAVEFPWFVKHRWWRANGVTKDRILGPTLKNALARLWWGAELTVREVEDYSITESLLGPGSQDVFNQLLGHRFSFYAPAGHSFVEKTEALSRGAIRKVAEGLSQMATTLVIESMTRPEVDNFIDELVQRATEDERTMAV